jgi:hypothetical protein
MPYNDQSEFPRGQFYSVLDAAATTNVAGDSAETANGGTLDTTIKVSSIILARVGATQTVTITDDDATTLFVVQVPASGTVELRRGFEVKNGLQFASTTDGANTHATVFYYKA